MKYIFIFLFVFLMATLNSSTIVCATETSSEAGIRLKLISNDEVNGYTQIAVQIKLPHNSVGIKELQTIISYDKEVLTLANKKDNSVTYSSHGTEPLVLVDSVSLVSDAVDVKITDINDKEYFVTDTTLCSQTGFSSVETIKVSLITFTEPSELQATDNWQDVFYLEFKTNVTTPVNENSIWFSTKEFLNTDSMYKGLTLGSDEWLNFFGTVNQSNDSTSYGFIPIGESDNRELMTAVGTGDFIFGTPNLIGDIDGNNSITATDATLIMDYIVGLNAVVNDANFHLADMNKSGDITAWDAILIMQKAISAD